MTLNVNLILEGADNVGKSSVIEELKKLITPTFIIKTGPGISKHRTWEDYIKMRSLLNSTTNIICDRMFLGEEFYAPIFRKYEVKYMREFEESIAPHNILIVLVASSRIIKERYDGEFVTEQQNIDINSMYINTFSRLKYKNKILMNTSDKTAKETAQRIMSKVWRIENALNSK